MNFSTPFFISHQERSGSTHLVHLLNSHPDIRCGMEVFHEVMIANSPTKNPEYSTVAQVHGKLNQIYNEDYKSMGFKYKHPVQHKLYPDVYEYLLELKDKMHIIFLYRNNLLKAAISRQNHNKLRELDKPSNLTSENYIDLGRLHLDVDNAIQQMKWRGELNEEYISGVKMFNKQYILSYEDLCFNTTKIMQEIFKFLKVDDTFTAINETTKKITENSVKDALENYDEVVERLTGTPYEKYLYQ